MLVSNVRETRPISRCGYTPIVRTVAHPNWTECHGTYPASDAANFTLDPFSSHGRPAFLSVHSFTDQNRYSFVQNELEVRNIRVPETTLVQEALIPGGVQVALISGIESTPLFAKNGRLIGRFFEDPDAKYCFLGDVRPSNTQASRGDQTNDVLTAIQDALADADMHFQDVVRTWFYNDDILAWYAEFNHARTAFFQQNKITLIPASTGIGVANLSGNALVCRVIAVHPKTSSVTVRRVVSPLQHEPSSYGSSFSRVMEVADRAGRILYISGTASILLNGETAHTGDIEGQIEKTMEVVEAILTHNGMNLSDCTRAIAYFRNREHMPFWEKYCRNHQLQELPVILTKCDVCRDDLLFEIELDAWKRNQP